MKARELWDSVRKGRTKAPLSERQRAYLIDLAKAEKIFDAGFTVVWLQDGTRVEIRPERRLAGGYGGVVSKVSTGRWYAQESYLIRFTDTGNTSIYQATDLDHFRRQGYTFEILKP
jgi:hypothetical protein